MWKTIVLGLTAAIGLAVSWVWIANEQFDHQITKRSKRCLNKPLPNSRSSSKKTWPGCLNLCSIGSVQPGLWGS